MLDALVGAELQQHGMKIVPMKTQADAFAWLASTQWQYICNRVLNRRAHPCSGKMVRLTIWGALAEAQGAALESLVHPIVSVAAAKVGDYDGTPQAGSELVQLSCSSRQPQGVL